MNKKTDALYYKSAGDYRIAFSQLYGETPPNWKDIKPLLANWIDTPLGTMMVVANDSALLLLEFTQWQGLKKYLNRLQMTFKTHLCVGESCLFQQIKYELNAYLAGKLKTFQTPILLIGTPFQRQVWQALLNLPYGETLTYSQLANKIDKGMAVRSVASANALNPLALLIPCHRIIGKNGQMRGYSGGIPKKEWLIHHEEKNK